MINAIRNTSPYYLDDTTLKFNYHTGQRQIMDSQARFILALAGTQSGKTVIGPWWLFREMKMRGRGDYLVVAPSFPLMDKKVLPAMRALFVRRLGLAEYKAGKRYFVLTKKGEKDLFGSVDANNPTYIFMGHAQDPDSLESATAKAALLDEAGQKKFKFGSWEAILRRLSIFRGRVLITTTPYTLGWLKNELHDKASTDENIDLIQFDSLTNPLFPKEEYLERKEAMPAWKFNMMYRGIFERPAGMIYDSFTRHHKIPRFDIPYDWKRHLGVDFGGVNTAGVYLAQSPITGNWFAYRTYHKGGRTAEEHARYMLRGEPIENLRATGGSWSEDQWRKEFKSGGLNIKKPPIKDVEVGINRVYKMFATNKLFIFDDLKELIDDLESYSRELDDNNEPTEKIEDKETFHLADGLRYASAEIESTKGGGLGPETVNI